MRAAWVLCGALCAAGPAQAFQPLLTDDTGTQGAAGNQLEGGIARSAEKRADASTATREAAATYTRGLTDALDLRLGTLHQSIVATGAPAVRGWGNAALGAKWRFFDDEKAGLSFALSPELQLPVSVGDEARGLGTARASWRFDLLMTQATGFGALHANVASAQVNFRDGALQAASRRTRLRLSLAPVWEISADWKLALDAGILTNPERAQRARMGYLEFGAVYAASKDLELAIGATRNFADGPARSTRLSAGVTWRFR